MTRIKYYLPGIILFLSNFLCCLLVAFALPEEKSGDLVLTSHREYFQLLIALTLIIIIAVYFFSYRVFDRNDRKKHNLSKLAVLTPQQKSNHRRYYRALTIAIIGNVVVLLASYL